MMCRQEDEQMLLELTRMAQLYGQRGQFDMAQKVHELAQQVRTRMLRTESNVVSISQWCDDHQNENNEA